MLWIESVDPGMVLAQTLRQALRDYQKKTGRDCPRAVIMANHGLDIYAPVGGTVVEVNAALGSTPEQLNQDPYGDGWIFVLEMSDASQVDTLLDADAYRRLVEEQ